MEIYLDNGATTRVCPEAAEAALKVMLEDYGNPSSTHRKGREAKAVLERARAQIMAALGARDGELAFTSGGSESDNWAILEGAEARRRVGRHILSSDAEHDAVKKTLEAARQRGWEVTLLPPGADGAVSPEAVREALRPDTALVSLMLVNNETGAITDIPGVRRVMKEAGSRALLHTDAVQGFLKVPFTAPSLGADLISLSGHKIHAPKGVGALYMAKGVRLSPLLFGGGQENGLRSGTEALPQIAAFGAAAEVGRREAAAAQQRMAALRQRCIDRVLSEAEDAVVIGGGAPHVLCLSLPGYRSEVLMNYLEAREIYVSKGSACKRGRRSHVLEAMGLPAGVIDGAIRVSLSRFTTEQEIDAFAEALLEARRTLRKSVR
ncbi:MAG: cysteine desulfurase family protein [Oscillospiraceae bacterium]|nr:cysteine desulfurase family protein [Oscillospiraceae bacterium]